jgi:transcriptional regulator with XRE-family HTH domain
VNVSRGAQYLDPEESWSWLSAQMKLLSISTVEELGDLAGINKGTISKYFHQKQRPTVDALPGLCNALQVSPETLLVAIGAWPKR